VTPAAERPKRSDYLAWSKRRLGARYNLARSGVARFPLAELSPSLDDLLTTDFHEDGWPVLLDAIAARYGVAAASVATTHGCSMANHLAYAASLEPGDEVLLETPVYEPLVTLARYLGARTAFFPRREENAWRTDPADVERLLTARTRLVVLSNLHNPTGAFDDEDTLAEIARAAERAGARVLVDEVYLEFLYAQGARTSAGRVPNLLATRSLTKAFGLDALRIGWVLAEPVLAERIRRLHDLFSVTTAHPSERLGALALARADDILARTHADLARHADQVDAFVRAQPALSWSKPRAGTVGFIRVDGADVDRVVERLHAEHDVAVAPGRFFGAPQHFRIGFGVATDDLRAGLDRLARVLAG
jgi:aspartate/methionine/tyrosine aminotransferase